jgi:hypothetical protein
MPKTPKRIAWVEELSEGGKMMKGGDVRFPILMFLLVSIAKDESFSMVVVARLCVRDIYTMKSGVTNKKVWTKGWYWMNETKMVSYLKPTTSLLLTVAVVYPSEILDIRYLACPKAPFDFMQPQISSKCDW